MPQSPPEIILGFPKYIPAREALPQISNEQVQSVWKCIRDYANIFEWEVPNIQGVSKFNRTFGMPIFERSLEPLELIK